MLLTLKTLEHQTFNIEIDAEQTVNELKKKIEELKGPLYSAPNQKLIYAGKIMNDEKKISEYNIDESKFIVIMVTKLKTTAATTPSTPTTTTTTAESNLSATPATTPAPQTSSPSSTTSTEAGSTSPTSAGSNPPNSPEKEVLLNAAESNLVVGEEFKNMVRQIMEMGYDKEQVEKALKASFNNPERAVEYLVTGLPTNLTREETQDSNTSSAASGETTETPVSGETLPSVPQNESNPLEFLRTQPQFLEMRQLIQSNPQLLSIIMQRIGQTNPNLLELITRNQETFVGMLNEPISGSGTPGSEAPAPVTGTGGAAGNVGHGMENLEHLIGSAQITPQDEEAINRLKALGFPDYLVIQAYFACDKNENLAANFLLLQGDD